MDILYNVGCTWNFEQLLRIVELNSRYRDKGVQIKSLFGSTQSGLFPLSSARPDFRIPHLGYDEFVKYVTYAKMANIDINYTINAPFVRSVSDVYRDKDMIIDTIQRLKEIGINNFIIADPLLLEIVAHLNVNIEISTIISSMNLNVLGYYKEYGVKKCCVNIYHNRDIKGLYSLHKAAGTLDIDIELLVNEFCMFGGVPCSEIMRDACYSHSALGGNREGYFNNWPFNRCQKARNNDPSSWLKAPFILPQHIRLYQELTGISSYKIAGRTNSIRQVDFLIEIYLNQNFGGNLLDLWSDPYNRSAVDCEHVIMVNDLVSRGFFDRWFKPIDGDINRYCGYCCGENCSWCDDIYAMIDAPLHKSISV